MDTQTEIDYTSARVERISPGRKGGRTAMPTIYDRHVGVLMIDGKTYYNPNNLFNGVADTNTRVQISQSLCELVIADPELGISDCFIGKPLCGSASLKKKLGLELDGFWITGPGIHSAEDAYMLYDNISDHYSKLLKEYGQTN